MRECRELDQYSYRETRVGPAGTGLGHPEKPKDGDKDTPHHRTKAIGNRQ